MLLFRFAFIFLIGNSAGNQNNISEEINKFGDILQADVADEYSALPDKVLSAYQWLYYSINNIATFYSFTDDDCFLNILNIYKHFKTNFSTLSNKHKVFCGFHLANEACPERWVQIFKPVVQYEHLIIKKLLYVSLNV